nr:unnamed protein product [Digitaria exilis]
MARPHVVVVTYPGSGNINPALQIAKLLHRHGVYVTFVNTEHNHRRFQDNEGAGPVRGRDGFRFEAIPDGLSEADRGKQDYGRGLAVSTSTRCAAPFRRLIERLNSTPGVPQVTCVLPTMLMSFALVVARELGIPTMAFWTGSAAALTTHMMLRDLQERGYVPLKDESYLTNGYLDKTIIDWIPGMPPISLGDFSSFLRTTDPNDFGLRFNESEANNCTKAGALILNTFDALEADVLAALRAQYPLIYTIGPQGSLLRHTLYDRATDGSSSTGLSLWKQNAECLAWLDTQQQGSVVYVNFGSRTVLTPEQLIEFAWGLAATGHPFLWSIRDNLVSGGGGGGVAMLPPAFTAETAGRCHLTSWCPQEKVLGHPAVGCFLTHINHELILHGVCSKEVPPLSGFSLAFRRHRRGDSVSHVASAEPPILVPPRNLHRDAELAREQLGVKVLVGLHREQHQPAAGDDPLHDGAKPGVVHEAPDAPVPQDVLLLHATHSSGPSGTTSPAAAGGLAALPPAFVPEAAGRCYLTSWCPQEKVLKHPAVGCFLTHSGWNSTCESLADGVPMACWPVFADQYTNCRYACEAWGVGVRLDAEVRREQVAERVREVMGSEEMRRSAARWKKEAEEATGPSGSSEKNLVAMVRALSGSSSNCSSEA